MKSPRILSTFALCAAFLAPSLKAEDLSSYRGFQLGMNLTTFMKLAGMDPSDVNVIHQRPALLQDVMWHPKSSPQNADRDTDPVKEVLFSFYNGQLCRMAVTYDRYKTEGLTAADMIEAISASYGTATTPAAEIIFPSIVNESTKVIARWEDSQYSFNLVRLSFPGGFGLVAVSKGLDGLAQAATFEAIRLDKEEAPQREAALRRKQAEESRSQLEKARLLNKASFRP